MTHSYLLFQNGEVYRFVTTYTRLEKLSGNGEFVTYTACENILMLLSKTERLEIVDTFSSLRDFLLYLEGQDNVVSRYLMGKMVVFI